MMMRSHLLRIILVVLYPLLVHLAVLWQQPVLMSLAFLSLSTAFSLQGLQNRNITVWVVYGLLNTVILLLTLVDKAIYFLYLPPILLPLLLFTVFFRSLLPGQEPIVTDIGEKARGPLSAEMRIYTRSVTLLWTVMFMLMILCAVLLPVYGSRELWSLVTNFLNYFICGLIFVAEFYYRQWRFPDHDHPGFFQYIQIVIAAQIQQHGGKS